MSECGLLDLPLELLCHISKDLPLESVGRLMSTHPSTREIASSNVYWWQRYEADIGEPDREIRGYILYKRVKSELNGKPPLDKFIYALRIKSLPLISVNMPKKINPVDDEMDLLGKIIDTGSVGLVSLCFHLFSKDSINHALYIAARDGHLEICKYLITKGADLHYRFKDYTPLDIAGYRGRLNICQYLFCETEITLLGRHLYNLCIRGDYTLVTSLITCGADVDYTYMSYTVLWAASQHGHSDIVRALCEAGAQVNKVSAENMTALYVAAQNGHTKCIDILLEFGADVNITRDGGYSPLYVASQKDHLGAVKSLIAANANVNKLTNKGFSALDNAIVNKCHRVIKFLLEHGGKQFETKN